MTRRLPVTDLGTGMSVEFVAIAGHVPVVTAGTGNVRIDILDIDEQPIRLARGTSTPSPRCFYPACRRRAIGTSCCPAAALPLSPRSRGQTCRRE